MAAWMIYAVIVALILSLAAYLAEYALRQRRAMTRWVWVSTVILSILVPCVITTVSIQLPSVDAPRKVAPPFPLREMTRVHLPIVNSHDSGDDIDLTDHSSYGNLDNLLFRGWILFSSLILIFVFLNTCLVRSQKKNWRSATIDRADVLIAPNSGPAVVGLFRPAIVLPSWLIAEADSYQRAAIAHEKSHLSARDPQFLAFTFLLLAVMPWNFVLWWQIRRLRRAMEIDCDARVLSDGYDLVEYCETLLKVGQRKSALIGPVAAMSESKSFLERRMKIMLVKPKKVTGLVAAMLIASSIGMVAIATQVTPPNAPSQGNSGAATSSSIQYADYVGSYQVGPVSVVDISLNGTQLVAAVNGKNPVILAQSGADTFTYAPANATFKFLRNGQGQVVAVTMNQNGRDHMANKIDEASANLIVENVTERVKNQQPFPGSDKAIRLILSDADSTAGMSTHVAEVRAKQKAQRETYLAKLGPVSSYEFEGVTSQGWDKYLVRHQNGTEQILLLLDSNGTIIGAARH